MYYTHTHYTLLHNDAHTYMHILYMYMYIYIYIYTHVGVSVVEYVGMQMHLEAHKSFVLDYIFHSEQKLDSVLKERQVLDRQKQDKLISTVSQTLTAAVNAKLDKVVKTEMKTHVIPGECESDS